MRKRLILVAVMVFAGTIVAASTVLANADNERNRVMEMHGVGGFEAASAHVNLIGYYNNNENPIHPTTYQVWYDVSGLPCTNTFDDGADLVYTLWATTPSSEDVRLQNFNTTCSTRRASNEVWKYSGDVLDTILTQPVRLWVTVDRTDGAGWPENHVVMEGQLDSP